MDDSRDDDGRTQSYYGLGVRDLAASPAVLREISNNSDLERLTLFGCGLSTLETLPPLRRLVELSAASNALGPALRLPRLDALRRLDVAHNRLEALGDGRLPALEILSVAGNALRSFERRGGFAGLAAFAPRLRTLDARDNNVADAGPLGACRRLEELEVSGNSFEDVDWARINPRLTTVDGRPVSLAVSVDDDDVEALIRGALEDEPSGYTPPRASYDSPPPYARRRDAAVAQSATTVQFEEARRQRLRADQAEARVAELELDKAACRAVQAASEADQAARARTRAEKRAAAAEARLRQEAGASSEAHERARAIATAGLLQVLAGAGRRGGRSRTVAAFYAWRRRTALETAKDARDKRRKETIAAARDAANQSAQDARRYERELAGLNDENQRLADARDVALAREADARSSASAADAAFLALADEVRLRGSLREAALEAAAHAAAREAGRAARKTAEDAAAARVALEVSGTQSLEASHAAFGAARALGATQTDALRQAEERDASARRQLAELRAAYARAAAGAADGRAAAEAGRGREADLKAALRELADVVDGQRAALRSEQRAKNDLVRALDRAEADKVRAADAALRATRDAAAEVARLEGKVAEARRRQDAGEARTREALAEAEAHSRELLAESGARADEASARVARARDAERAAGAAAAAAAAERDSLVLLAETATGAAEAAEGEARRRGDLIEGLQRDAEALRKVNRDADEDLRDAERERDGLRDERSALAKDVEGLHGQLRAQVDVEQHLRAVISELRSAKADGEEPARAVVLERRLDDREQQLQYVEAELLGLSQVFERKERDLREKLTGEAERLRAEADELKAAAARADGDLRKSREAIVALREQLLAAERARMDSPPPAPPRRTRPALVPY